MTTGKTFAQTHGCEGVKLHSKDLDFKVLDIENEKKVNYSMWDRQRKDPWDGVNKVATFTLENGEEVSITAGTMVLKESSSNVYKIISVPYGKGEEILLWLAQLDSSLEDEDEINGFIADTRLGKPGDKGTFEEGECTERRKCSGIIVRDISDVYIYNNNKDSIARSTNNFSGKKESISNFALYKILTFKDPTTRNPNGEMKSRFMSRSCTSYNTGETEDSLFFAPIGVEPENLITDQNKIEEYKIIELNPRAMEDLHFGFVKKIDAHVIQKYVNKVGVWALKASEFDGDILIQNAYAENYVPFNYFKFIPSMDLVQIPTSIKFDEGGLVYLKGPFNSVHYPEEKAKARVEDHDEDDVSDTIYREKARDSFLLPAAACGFINALEIYQRRCFKDVYKEKNRSEYAGKDIRNYNPLECYKGDDPSDCICDPIQWGDMFYPHSFKETGHKTHDDKVCVDVRVQTRGLGAGSDGYVSLEKNKRMIMAFIDSGVTEVIYGGRHTNAIRDHIKKVYRDRNVKLDLNWITTQGHLFHVHMCWRHGFENRRLRDQNYNSRLRNGGYGNSRKMKEYLELANTCNHPRSKNPKVYLNY